MAQKLFSILVCTVLVLTALSSVSSGQKDTTADKQDAITTQEPFWNVGMLPPRIDGYLDHGGNNKMSEWGDAPPRRVTLVSGEGSQTTAELSVKVVGNNLYLALDVAYPRQPEVYLLFDREGDCKAEQMVASVKGTSANFQLEKGEWTPVEEFEKRFGETAMVPSYQGKRWTAEAVYGGPSQATSASHLNWTAVVKDPVDGRSYVIQELLPASGKATLALDVNGYPVSETSCLGTVSIDWEMTDVPEIVLFPRVDVGVTGIEVTQAIQTADMEMPLVLGKTSLARVYVDPGPSPVEVEVTLSAYQFIGIGTIPLGSVTKTFIAQPNPQRDDFGHSANFVMPQEWTEWPWLFLKAEVRPLSLGTILFVMEADDSDNTLASAFLFQETRDLVVWTVPIAQDTDGDGTSEFRNQATINTWINYTEAMLPTANLVQVDMPWNTFPDMAGCSTNQCNGQLYNWTGAVVLGMLFATLLGADPDDLPPFPDQVHGITPGGGMGGGVSSPAWCTPGNCGGFSGEYGPGNIGKTTSLVSVCGDAAPSSVTCPAHEITHNLGPYRFDGNDDGDFTDTVDEAWGAHLAACGAGGSDAVWAANYQPYNIKDLGWDPLVANPGTNQQALIPSNYPDYMTYCGANSAGFPVPYQNPNVLQWISTLRWEWMFNKLQNWQPGNPAAPYNGRSSQDSVDPNSTYRVIGGVVPRDGSEASFGYSWTNPGIITEDFKNYDDNLTQGNYTIIARDSKGEVLEEIYFYPFHTNVEGEPADYVFTYFVQDDGKIFSIELLHQDTTVDTLYSSGAPETRMHTLKETQLTRTEGVELSWNDAGGSSSRETLYQLEYSWGKGLWLPVGSPTNATGTSLELGTLPGGEKSQFRIRAMNGFDTYYAESEIFDVPNQAPRVKLSDNGGKFTVHSTISYKATVQDPDMEKIDPERIIWYLDGEEVGRGSIVKVNAGPVDGTFVLQASYTDRHGATGEAEVMLRVVPRKFPTLDELAEFQKAVAENLTRDGKTNYTTEEQIYFETLKTALDDDSLSPEEQKLLGSLREQYGISQELHDQMVKEIRSDPDFKPTVAEPDEKTSVPSLSVVITLATLVAIVALRRRPK